MEIELGKANLKHRLKSSKAKLIKAFKSAHTSLAMHTTLKLTLVISIGVEDGMVCSPLKGYHLYTRVGNKHSPTCPGECQTTWASTNLSLFVAFIKGTRPMASAVKIKFPSALYTHPTDK